MPKELAVVTLLMLFAVFGTMLCVALFSRPGALLGDDLVLLHPLWVRGFALFLAFGVPCGITLVAHYEPPRTQGETWAMLECYALFAVLSAPLLWEAMGFALVVSEDGLSCRSPWRGRRFLSWGEVEEVSFTGPNFVIRSMDGWKFRVPTGVSQLERFLQACERHLPWAALIGAEPGYARLGRAFPEPPNEPALRSKWHARSESYRAARDAYQE